MEYNQQPYNIIDYQAEQNPQQQPELNIANSPNLQNSQSHKLFQAYINSETNSGIYYANNNNNSQSSNNSKFNTLNQSPCSSEYNRYNRKSNSYKAQVPYMSSVNYNSNYMSENNSNMNGSDGNLTQQQLNATLSQASLFQQNDGKYVGIIKQLMKKIDELVLELNEQNEINSQLLGENTDLKGQIKSYQINEEKILQENKLLKQNNIKSDNEIMQSVSQSLEQFDSINKLQTPICDKTKEIEKLKIEVQKLKNSLNYQEIVSKNRKIELEMAKNKEKQQQKELKKINEQLDKGKKNRQRQNSNDKKQTNRTSVINLYDTVNEEKNKQTYKVTESDQKINNQNQKDSQPQQQKQSTKSIKIDIYKSMENKNNSDDNNYGISSVQKPTETTLQTYYQSSNLQSSNSKQQTENKQFPIDSENQQKGESYLNFSQISENNSKSPININQLKILQNQQFNNDQSKNKQQISLNVNNAKNQNSYNRLPQDSLRLTHRSQQMGSGFQELSLIVNDKQQESNNMILIDMLECDTYNNFQTPSPSCKNKKKAKILGGSLQKLATDLSDIKVDREDMKNPKTCEKQMQESNSQSGNLIGGNKLYNKVRLTNSTKVMVQGNNNLSQQQQQSLYQSNINNKSTISTTSSMYQYNQPLTRVQYEQQASQQQGNKNQTGNSKQNNKQYSQKESSKLPQSNNNNFIAKNINSLKTIYIKKQEQRKNSRKFSNNNEL